MFLILSQLHSTFDLQNGLQTLSIEEPLLHISHQLKFNDYSISTDKSDRRSMKNPQPINQLIKLQSDTLSHRSNDWSPVTCKQVSTVDKLSFIRTNWTASLANFTNPRLTSNKDFGMPKQIFHFHLSQ